MPILLILFIIIPIAEIATFIQVGDIIGLFPTIAVIILTAIIGSILVRYQGLSVFSKFKENVESGEIPLEPALHGLFLLVSGLLLITPGFLTDSIGFLLLIPDVRLKLGLFLFEKIKQSADIKVYPHQPSYTQDPNDPMQSGGPIIEGEIIVEEVETKPNPESKWAKRDNKSDK